METIGESSRYIEYERHHGRRFRADHLPAAASRRRRPGGPAPPLLRPPGSAQADDPTAAQPADPEACRRLRRAPGGVPGGKPLAGRVRARAVAALLPLA